MFNAGIRHLHHAQLDNIPMKPKHHKFVHVLVRSKFCGNPETDSTFLDEAANRQLAAICRVAYPAVWEARDVSNFGLLRTMQQRD